MKMKKRQLIMIKDNIGFIVITGITIYGLILFTANQFYKKRRSNEED